MRVFWIFHLCGEEVNLIPEAFSATRTERECTQTIRGGESAQGGDGGNNIKVGKDTSWAPGNKLPPERWHGWHSCVNKKQEMPGNKFQMPTCIPPDSPNQESAAEHIQTLNYSNIWSNSGWHRVEKYSELPQEHKCLTKGTHGSSEQLL